MLNVICHRKVWLRFALVLGAVAGGFSVLGQGGMADYDRALSLRQRTEGKVFRNSVNPHWLPGGNRFWYRIETGPSKSSLMVVDASTGEKSPAIDAQKLASSLSVATGAEASADSLNLDSIQFTEDLQTVEFRHADRWWRWSESKHQLAEAANRERLMIPLELPLEDLASHGQGGETSLTIVNQRAEPVDLFWMDADGRKRPYGAIAPGQEKRQHTFAGHVWAVLNAEGELLAALEAEEASGRFIVKPKAGERTRKPEQAQPEPGVSPDGKWVAKAESGRIELRNTSSGERSSIAVDTAADEALLPEFFWSPNSSHLVLPILQKGGDRKLHLVESSPRDQLQPRLHTLDYLKPGDKIEHRRPGLFDISSRRQVFISGELFTNSWSLEDFRWEADSSAFLFSFNQRGHQNLRVLRVDASTGNVKPVISEHSDSFLDYAAKYLYRVLEGGKEAIWMSERDGWNHLYLYDLASGEVKNQITKGEWVVRRVERVDEAKRQIWFLAGGVRPNQDPYYLHLCRIDFDGTGLRVLTEGDGTHAVQFSPDRRFFLDAWSRVDQPPVTELRRSEDGKLICVLERADWSNLTREGWTAPERFAAKGRDGKTDIFGIIIRPSNFDPKLKYPVIEEIYAGPQAAFVPKEFGLQPRQHAIAELGFIVVQIDGMGTSHRSKAFHDVAWKNLGDAGFPDRIAWMKTAARTRPWMDLERVGIYGGSAGGQSSTRALLAFGDFYKVAVSDCGCHDNRMDKMWWNELYMGWPVGKEYEEQSNVTQAHNLKGKLMLIVGEMDRNVDPASTMQVVDALIKADKDFDLLVVPGGGHGIAESPYGSRRRMDFFVRHLLGKEPRWTARN